MGDEVEPALNAFAITFKAGSTRPDNQPMDQIRSTVYPRPCRRAVLRCGAGGGSSGRTRPVLNGGAGAPQRASAWPGRMSIPAGFQQRLAVCRGCRANRCWPGSAHPGYLHGASPTTVDRSDGHDAEHPAWLQDPTPRRRGAAPGRSGLSDAEIAATLEVSEAAVKTPVARMLEHEPGRASPICPRPAASSPGCNRFISDQNGYAGSIDQAARQGG